MQNALKTTYIQCYIDLLPIRKILISILFKPYILNNLKYDCVYNLFRNRQLNVVLVCCKIPSFNI